MRVESLILDRHPEAAIALDTNEKLLEEWQILGNGSHAVGHSSQLAFASAVITLLERAVDARDQNESKRFIIKAADLTRSWSEGAVALAVSPVRGGLAPWQVKQTKKYVEGNLAKTIKIKDLARLVGLGSSYFFQAFRCTVGISPHTFIIQRRIEHAQNMILLTDKPLSEIALECGFADQPHLTRLFRTIVGVSPGVWRRTHVGVKTAQGVRDREPAGVAIDCTFVERLERPRLW
jgi:AraC family transcriptional regulator